MKYFKMKSMSFSCGFLHRSFKKQLQVPSIFFFCLFLVTFYYCCKLQDLLEEMVSFCDKTKDHRFNSIKPSASLDIDFLQDIYKKKVEKQKVWFEIEPNWCVTNGLLSFKPLFVKLSVKVMLLFADISLFSSSFSLLSVVKHIN